MKEPVSEAYKTFNKAIDMVLKNPPGPSRWRAAHDMWLTLSPKNRVESSALAKECTATRRLLKETNNKFGLGQEKNLRQYMAFPHGAYYAIMRADPQAFSLKNNAAKMHKTFPEYTNTEIY